MAADSNSDNPLDQLRPSLMPDVLPVGLAALALHRQAGSRYAVEAYTSGWGAAIADVREEEDSVERVLAA